MNNVSKDHIIFREPEIVVDSEMRKSDLVIKKPWHDLHSWHTVRYENNDSLRKARKKCKKYKGVAETLKRKLVAKEGLHHCLTSAGAEEQWPRAILENLKVLEVQTKHALTCFINRPSIVDKNG